MNIKEFTRKEEVIPNKEVIDEKVKDNGLVETIEIKQLNKITEFIINGDTVRLNKDDDKETLLTLLALEAVLYNNKNTENVIYGVKQGIYNHFNLWDIANSSEVIEDINGNSVVCNEYTLNVGAVIPMEINFTVSSNGSFQFIL